MKEIVEVIAKAIVNHPSEVQVEEERRLLDAVKRES